MAELQRADHGEAGKPAFKRQDSKVTSQHLRSASTAGGSAAAADAKNRRTAAMAFWPATANG